MAANSVNIEIEKIIRTKRKTIALHITDDATLIVRAPLHATDDLIKKVILKHKKWIEKKKTGIQSRAFKFCQKEFVNGEGFLYLGRYFKLTIVDNQKVKIKFENGFYLSRDAVPNAEKEFIKLYKKLAYEKISERVKWYAEKRSFKYSSIKISSAQKRWGSCSNKNNLNFSWRLIMAPLPVIDYVVVHELAHIEEKNHSKSFWNIVKTLMPDYKRYEYWLKKNGYLLRL